jgi:hypothetical protein
MNYLREGAVFGEVVEATNDSLRIFLSLRSYLCHSRLKESEQMYRMGGWRGQTPYAWSTRACPSLLLLARRPASTQTTSTPPELRSQVTQRPNRRVPIAAMRWPPPECLMSLLQRATPVAAIRIIEVCWLGARMGEAGGGEAV